MFSYLKIQKTIFFNFSGMRNLVFIYLIVFTIASCKNSSKLSYAPNYDMNYTYKMGDIKNHEINLMKLTPFERALINTWPEMTEEQQNEIKTYFISSSKVDSLFYPKEK
jgi:hypothetical protein